MILYQKVYQIYYTYLTDMPGPLISKIFSGLTLRGTNQTFICQDANVTPEFYVLTLDVSSRLLVLQGDAIITGGLTVDTLNYTFLNPPIIGGGDVVGPAPGPSTDNAVTRWSGVTGGIIQNSLVIINDAGNITTPGDLAAVGGVFSGTLAFPALSGPLPIGLGDIVSLGASTDNAFVRFDGVTGKIIQNSLLTLDDSGNISRSGALYIHEIGTDNFGAATLALGSVAGGTGNTAVGNRAATNTVSGFDNIAVGRDSLLENISGDENTVVGSFSLAALTNGLENTVIGNKALGVITTGSNNIAIGSGAASDLTIADSNNIHIQNVGVAGSNNLIVIGTVGSHTNVCLPGSLSLKEEQYHVPFSGEVFIIVNTTSVVILDLAAPLALLTITMPVAPFDGQLLTIIITDDITALTHLGNGNTIVDPFPASIFGPTSQEWYFRLADLTWYPSTCARPGDVTGPVASTNNAIARFDGVTGKLLQNSNITIDNDGNFQKNAIDFLHEPVGSGSLGVGTSALEVDSGTNNTGVGQIALKNNIVGSNNTAVGSSVMTLNTAGNRNTAVGRFALNAVNQDNNTAIGYKSLLVNIASDNTAVGYNTLTGNTTGLRNSAFGTQCLESNVIGIDCTAVGYQALRLNTGSSNTAVGSSALVKNEGGTQNVAVGLNALGFNTSGIENVAVGSLSLSNNTTGDNNTALGSESLLSITTGANNIAIGMDAGSLLTASDSNNINIGSTGVSGDSGEIRIGSSGIHVKNFQAGIVGVTTDIADAIDVFIDSSGQLGTISSSARYKTNIHKINDQTLDKLLKLNSYGFEYKKHPGKQEYGLIAEEVLDILPELVVFRDDIPQTVQYHKLHAMLLGLIKRQHYRLEKLSTELDELRMMI